MAQDLVLATFFGNWWNLCGMAMLSDLLASITN